MSGLVRILQGINVRTGTTSDTVAGGEVAAADALVKTATAALPNARVVTDTATVTADWSTPGQVKLNATAGAGSPLTTKGDLYGYSTTNARVPVGSNGKVLTADSTAAAGVSWQTPTDTGITQLTGDVTAGPGSGSQVATIAAQAVTAAKMTAAATQRLFGRNTAGAGAGEEVTASQVLDWLSSTRGAVLYRGASGWAVLAPGTAGQVLRTGGSGADPSWQDGPNHFGGGGDGAIDFDGSSTVLGVAPVANVYTMTADMSATTCRTRSGVRVDWGGYVPYVNGVATFDDATAIWSRNGSDATNNNAGPNVSAGSVITTAPVGATGRTTLGTPSNAGNATNCLGARGGSGGAAGGQSGSASGTRTVPNATQGSWSDLGFAERKGRTMNAASFLATVGGTGGGAGGCNPGTGTATSGAGGTGGGFLLAFCRYVSGPGILEANGGRGGDALATGNGAAGGGGGGGGGYVMLVTSSPSPSVTLRALGGAVGVGAGGGNNGAAGGAGNTLTITV